MLHQFGNDDPDVIDGQLADHAGKQEHEFAVGFLPMLDDAFQQESQRLVLLFESAALSFQLADSQLQLMPSLLYLLDRSYGWFRTHCLCHT
ncbi:MAG: hypothetical protein HY298_03705 [Verrucomicrobia bacterium]|nr:hypothetical protein [Verrucomicrobiota bacterium]